MKTAMDMLYLTICAVNEEVPSLERIEQMQLQELFRMCQKHTLTACVAYALESAGIKNHAFTEAKEKSIRKNILFDAERKKILQRLEQEKIWHLPLKGSVLKDWYPKMGMRQMSDNDILCDAAYRTKIRDLMLEMGFTCEHFGVNNDDAYFKAPVYNFEMHHELFTSASIKKFHEYYQNIKSKLIKDETDYGYHFRTEDFYIYMTAHEYKHFSEGGIGIRALADCYVVMKKFYGSMDWNYLEKEFQTLNLVEYEQKRRLLSEKIFHHEQLSEEEQKMLQYYLCSGAYGTLENEVINHMNRIENDSKMQYVFHRLFPSMEEIETYWNFFYRHKWLIPVLWFYRPIHGLFFKHDRICSELKYLITNKKSST